LADESQEIFREKVKLLKFSRKSEHFSEIGGKSETGGKNASWSQGGWTPLNGFMAITITNFTITN